MTQNEYAQAVEAIDVKYREDRAALERVWILLNGSKAPDSLVDVAGSDRVVMRSAEELGIPPAAAIDQRTAVRATHLSEGAKAKKKAYMKAYWEKRKRKKAE